MHAFTRTHAMAVLLSLALHAMVWVLASADPFVDRRTAKALAKAELVFLQILPPAPAKVRADAPAPPPRTEARLAPMPSLALATDASGPSAAPHKEAASMAAPPAPSAQEWAFAASYTHKNSKAYRYSWGQQVRSMMGTAVEGPDQGFVRFRVNIAPDGTLARLDTLWTTSVLAEQLARQAIEAMPSLPPTPTGKPLVFEKTISFTPHAADGPPSYKDDCLPDPPAFRNPFAWDGQSPQQRAEPTKTAALDPQALQECLRQLPQDSIEAEVARDRQAMQRWGSTSPDR